MLRIGNTNSRVANMSQRSKTGVHVTSVSRVAEFCSRTFVIEGDLLTWDIDKINTFAILAGKR